MAAEMHDDRPLGVSRVPPVPLDFNGARVLFVASTGGHLIELRRLADAMRAAEDSIWVTFDSEQSRSLLAGRPVRHVPYIRPRGYWSVVQAVGAFRRILEETRPAAGVSTGAGVALGAFLAARRCGIPGHYIESIARLDGPSMTGRVTAALRLAGLHTPHRGWAAGRWLPYPSLLSDWEVLPATSQEMPDTRPRLFVSLGTIRPYRFDSLVDAVLATGLVDERTTWQLGATSRDDLPGRTVDVMSGPEFESCCREADVVITHAGVGTAISLFEAGQFPVVVPRRASRKEHVDDHQEQIARLLGRLGKAAVAEPEGLSSSLIQRAAGMRIRSRAATPKA